MSDISKCTGEGCDKKERCYRFTAPACRYMQSYFVEVPIKDGKCSEFWSNEGRKVVKPDVEKYMRKQSSKKGAKK